MKNILCKVLLSAVITLCNSCSANNDVIKTSLDNLYNICQQTIQPSFNVKAEAALLGSASIDLGYEIDTHLIPEAVKLEQNLSRISGIVYNMKQEYDTINQLKYNISRNIHFLRNSYVPNPRYKKLNSEIDNLQSVLNQM
ncbi:MAG: hypothetical protein IJ848_03385 [Alphaproteobacteria bacterium]|nr:hypothetical protein [Alphaproteobacteria bacterium]